MDNKWHIINKIRISDKLDIKDIIELILINRGYVTQKDRAAFLSPSFKQIDSQIIGLDDNTLQKSFKRILQAIHKGENISVYTDYDADGICAGAIIWENLYQYTKKVMPYIPDRINEGYGLTEFGLDKIKEIHNSTLIVATDMGVTAHKQIDYANKKGIDVIVLDHHQKTAKKLNAYILIHTTKVSAASIAWYFASKFDAYMNKNKKSEVDFSKNIDLAALSTVSDLMPLNGINRLIVKEGIKNLANTNRPGLKELIKISGIKNNLNTYHLSFILIPRINAAGRIADATDSLRLLCTKDKEKAKSLAIKINKYNMIRQEETIKSFSNAMNKIDEMKLINRVKKKFEKIIVIGEESYKEGIIGLIAGKITEKYNLPAIVVTLNSHIAKGSARSIPGFNIVSVLNEMSKYLLEFGGHPMAAGFSMKTENFEKFKRKIIKIADEKITTDMMQKILSIDMALPEKYINLRFFNAIIQMEPFGIGNPEPVFITYNLKLIGMRKIGKDNKHLKLKIRLQSGIDIEAIGFNMGNRFNSILGGKFLDIVYTLQENLYNDVSALQLNIRDVKISV